MCFVGTTVASLSLRSWLFRRVRYSFSRRVCRRFRSELRLPNVEEDVEGQEEENGLSASQRVLEHIAVYLLQGHGNAESLSVIKTFSTCGAVVTAL